MAGIFEEIQMREDAYANNPQALQQRYAQSQQLVDLLALQKVNNEQQAAARSIQAQMETNPSTVKDQLGLQALSGARSEIVSELAPGIRQRGQQMQQMAARQSMGMPSMNASNMQRMADGGIVGYAEPSLLQKAKQGLGQSMMDMGSNMQESDQIIRNSMPFITQMLGKGPALTEQERAELKATVEQDPGLIGIFGKQLENLGIYVKDMAGGGIVSFVKGGETGFPDLNKDGEVTQADILMGRGVVGKQEGGIVSFAQGDPVVDPENRLLDLSELVGVTEEDPISVPEAEGRLGDELGAAIEAGASSVLDYVKENPVDAASLGLMFIPGVGLAGRGLAALSRIPAVRNAVTGAGRLAQKAVTKPARGIDGRTIVRNNPKTGKFENFRKFDPVRTAGVTGAALGLGNSLLGGDDTDAIVAEEIIKTAPTSQQKLDSIVDLPRVGRKEAPKKSGLAGANIDFDMLRQQGAAAAGGTTTGQSLALAGAATGAEQARREQVAEKRRSDDARNAVLEQQIQATIGAQTGRTRLAILEIFDSYKQPINRARRDKDIADILQVEVKEISKQPAELVKQAELLADRRFLEQLQGLAGSSIGNAVSAGGLPEGVIVTRRD